MLFNSPYVWYKDLTNSANACTEHSQHIHIHIFYTNDNDDMLMLATAAARRQIASTSINTASVSWKCLFQKGKVKNANKYFFSSNSNSNNSWNWSQSSASATPSSEDLEEPETISASVQTKIMDGCSSLHASVMPLNSKLVGPLAKNSDKGTSLPFVFLVGNHSSGKSSFINYVIGRDVQTAGVAPTDDCFTVVAPGPEDNDQDGPALIGDPDMGFSALRQFGPALIHHTQLKVRSGISTDAFMMIDSPGMIDSPVSQSGVPGYASAGSTSPSADRGYDFQGVVRWFAERADVVLLFFDPDKPGTTGETLNILLHSLGGMDHKLLIVLNKADQFKKVSFDIASALASCMFSLNSLMFNYEHLY